MDKKYFYQEIWCRVYDKIKDGADKQGVDGSNVGVSFNVLRDISMSGRFVDGTLLHIGKCFADRPTIAGEIFDRAGILLQCDSYENGRSPSIMADDFGERLNYFEVEVAIEMIDWLKDEEY